MKKGVRDIISFPHCRRHFVSETMKERVGKGRLSIYALRFFITARLQQRDSGGHVFVITKYIFNLFIACKYHKICILNKTFFFIHPVATMVLNDLKMHVKIIISCIYVQPILFTVLQNTSFLVQLYWCWFSLTLLCVQASGLYALFNLLRLMVVYGLFKLLIDGPTT